jgi:hypothetical protein
MSMAVGLAAAAITVVQLLLLARVVSSWVLVLVGFFAVPPTRRRSGRSGVPAPCASPRSCSRWPSGGWYDADGGAGKRTDFAGSTRVTVRPTELRL